MKDGHADWDAHSAAIALYVENLVLALQGYVDKEDNQVAYQAQATTAPSRIIQRPVRVWGTYRTMARFILIFTDAWLLAFAFLVAYLLRFHFGIAIETDVVGNPTQYAMLNLLLIPVWLTLFAMLRLYDFHRLLGGTNEYAQVLNGCTSGMVFIVVISFFFPDFRISRSWLMLSWVITTLVVIAGRLSLRRIAYSLRSRGLFVSPAVIIGTNHEAVALAEQLKGSKGSGFAILGYISTENPANRSSRSQLGLDFPVLGDLHSLESIVREYNIEDVIIATTALDADQMMQLPEHLSRYPNVEIRLSSGLYEIFTTGMRISTHNYVPLMTINRLRLNTNQLTIKTVMDYAIILLLLPFLLPFMALIAVMIKLDSPGPVIYRRHVMGVGGREFDAFKFRTMVVNGDEMLAQSPALLEELQKNHKLKDDPRVTRVGKWLRKTSLDELPQLANVLRGQMSLVGPRMITPNETSQYGQMQFNLLTVKPGLTGLWQVSGRSDLSYAERVQIDMHYIRNYNVWFDLQILFIQTPSALLQRRGAY